MSQKQQIQRAFHKAAQSYDAYAHQQRDVLQRLIELAKPYAENVPYILDVGCGTGQLKQLSGWQAVIGCDLAEGMCMKARQQGELAVIADMNALPLKNVPLLCSSLALQWSDNTAQTLAEWSNALSPGGIMVLSTYLDKTLSSLTEAYELLSEPLPIREFVPYNTLLDLIKNVDLQIVSSESITLTKKNKSLKDMFLYMKMIGAHTPPSKSRGLRTPRFFERLTKAYKAKDEAGLLSEWEVGFVIARKKA